MANVNLSAWAIKNQAMVLYLMLALLCAGAFSYLRLARKEDPDFSFKVLAVKVEWPGATAREMEQQVTARIERALEDIPWLDNVSSDSRAGVADIFVTLKDAMPPSGLDGAWQAVRKKLSAAKASLPDGVVGPTVDDEFGATFGSIYALTSDQPNRAELERWARQAKHELARITDVGKVKLIGIQKENIYIDFSSAKLLALGLDPLKVASLVAAQNVMQSAGELLTGEGITRVRVEGDFRSLQGIADIRIPIKGAAVRLGDIVHIYRGNENPARFKMRYRGRDAVGVAVSLAKDANAIAVGAALDETMDRFRASLPPGVHLHQISDQPQVVKRSIEQFMKSLLEALVIVLAISFLGLGWRAGLVVAFSIPLVLAGTFLLMNLFGIDLQRVSVGALIIAIGLLVDDAMIAVEMMKVKLAQGHDRDYATTFAYTSTAWPMLTGTLITAAAFLPVGLAKSSAGEYTFSICAVVSIALLVSWLVAVVFTPWIGYHLLREPPSQAHGFYQNRFYQRLRKLVAGSLAYRKTVVFATVAVFVLAVAGFDKVEQQFFPPSERPELLVDAWLPEGAAFAATEALAAEIEKTLNGDKDVVQYASYIGGSSPRFYLPLDLQLPTVNYAQIVITTRDTEAREAVLKRLRNTIDKDFPESGIRVSRLENGPPVGYPIQFRVIGEDPAKIRTIADQVIQVIKQNRYAKNVSQDSNESIGVLKVALVDKKASLDVSPQRLARYLQMYLSGATVNRYREGEDGIDVVMRANGADRHDGDFFKHAAIYSESGKPLPLESIATIREDMEDGIIYHMNGQPIVTVRADIPDDVQAPGVSSAIDRNLAGIRSTLPKGYRIEAGGAMENSDKATDSVIEVLPLTSFIILSLLMMQLRHFGLLALVLLTAPLGIIGVTASLLAFKVPFGFVAMLGMISLAGMIMRNSIILVDQVQQDMARGLSRHAAIVESTVRRARPILLTAAAAILAMVPLMTSLFWGAMAIVIMGGLLVATLLTLLYLPALYAAWFRIR